MADRAVSQPCATIPLGIFRGINVCHFRKICSFITAVISPLATEKVIDKTMLDLHFTTPEANHITCNLVITLPVDLKI